MPFDETHITPEQNMIYEGEPGVICAALGNNIGRVIINTHMHELDNELCLGFPIEMIVDNLRPELEFTDRNDSQMDNQKFIAKHK